jgi:hypothetical protein
MDLHARMLVERPEAPNVIFAPAAPPEAAETP